MLTISSKSKYGIMATLFLAEHHGGGLVQLKDIADLNHIPSQFLAQIFSLLGKADIVTSVRGKSGGYRLSRNPTEVTVLEILEALEGGIELTGKNSTGDTAVTELFSTAEQRLREVFKMSLAELLVRQQEKQNILNFDI